MDQLFLILAEDPLLEVAGLEAVLDFRGLWKLFHAVLANQNNIKASIHRSLGQSARPS